MFTFRDNDTETTDTLFLNCIYSITFGMTSKIGYQAIISPQPLKREYLFRMTLHNNKHSFTINILLNLTKFFLQTCKKSNKTYNFLAF